MARPPSKPACSDRRTEHLSDWWERGAPPDMRQLLARWPKLSPSQWIEVLVTDQQLSWQHGRARRVEHYLEQFPQLTDHQSALGDLLYGEFRGRRGEDPQLVPEDVARFQNEMLAVAALDHPHIVPLYESGRHDGQYYFTMKLIGGGGDPGRSLVDFAGGPRTGARIDDWQRQILRLRLDGATWQWFADHVPCRSPEAVRKEHKRVLASLASELTDEDAHRNIYP